MDNTPVPKVNVENLRKALELATKETTEAQKAVQEANEQRKIINRIPKGKAGSGKEAKRVANQNYHRARDDLKKKTVSLEIAEQALRNVDFMATTTNGNYRNLVLEQPSVDKQLISDCDSERENEHGIQTEAASSSSVSRILPKDPDIQAPHHLDETLPNTTICEGGRASDAPSNSPNKQRNDFGKAEVNINWNESQAYGDGVTSESSLSGDKLSIHHSDEVPVNQNSHEDTSMGFARPLDGLGEAGSNAKPHVSGVSTKRCRKDGEVFKSPQKKMRVTRASRVTHSKVESEGKGTEAKAAEELCPVSEIEEDEWATFLSDPPSDTDVENEKQRVVEAKKSKHPNLNEEEKRMYRMMMADAKQAYEEKACTAIEGYLESGLDIDIGIRKMARYDPMFLLEAATTSREVALHFLTTNEGNIMCGYHSFRNKASYIRDGWGKPGMKVRGTPGKRKVVTSGKKTKPDPKGLSNCGCMIHDILLEFALSKLISISRFIDGDRRKEMMTFQDYMEPRNQSFTFQAIRLAVPDLSLNDFYSHGDAAKHDLRVAKKRADYWANSTRKPLNTTGVKQGDSDVIEAMTRTCSICMTWFCEPSGHFQSLAQAPISHLLPKPFFLTIDKLPDLHFD